MTGGELIVKLLELHGIRHIFGTPGDQVKIISDALHSCQKIGYYTTQTSQGASFMADGYARATGNVGVCITPGGGSAVNTAVSLAAAYADSIPLLLITGQVPSPGLPSTGTKEKHKGYNEHVNLFDLFKPIVKWNARIDSAASLPSATARAFKALQTGRRRPVHLEIPVDLLASEMNEPVVLKAAPIRKTPGGSPSLNAFAAEILVRAKSPLIIAGGGVVSANLKEREILRNVLDESAISSVGGTQLVDSMLMNFEVAHARWLLHTCDLRPMGYALPAAIGAKCAHRDRQVVAVTNTEEFSMTGRELIEANQYGLGIPVIVINNHESSEKPESVKFAEMFGVPGFHVRNDDEFAPALKEALMSRECVLIDVQLS